MESYYNPCSKTVEIVFDIDDVDTIKRLQNIVKADLQQSIQRNDIAKSVMLFSRNNKLLRCIESLEEGSRNEVLGYD